jgi:hypothetical protein
MSDRSFSRPKGALRGPLFSRLFGAFLALGALAATPASADKLKHPVAVFSGLDKITGRIITFEVATNETVQFGSLQITERVCYSRPPTEAPQTDTFVEIDNIDANNQYKRVFTGWMFADSPSLHALDHPVYDIWLLRCKGTGELIPSPPDTASTDTQDQQPLQPQQKQQPQQATRPDIQPNGKPAPKLKGAPTDNDAQQGTQDDQQPVDVPPPPGFVPPGQQQQRDPSQFYAPAPNGNGLY